jgi:hypothetical protein
MKIIANVREPFPVARKAARVAGSVKNDDRLAFTL